jgi:hypothetical protein
MLIRIAVVAGCRIETRLEHHRTIEGQTEGVLRGNMHAMKLVVLV